MSTSARRVGGLLGASKTSRGNTDMPTIDILILALIIGGALAFMAEMVWFSMDHNKLPRK
jgi:hypothetical protein